MKPSRDPDSPKYRDDPDRVWHAGRWRTIPEIEGDLRRVLAWQAGNRAAKREHNRKYREMNRDSINERARAWRAANPEYGRSYHAAHSFKKSRRKRLLYAAKRVETLTEKALEMYA